MYSENPRVLHICRSQLTLTLEFRKELYAAWIKEPKPLTVRRMLEKNGFDIRSIGHNFYKNIALSFKRCGEPKYSRKPPAHTEAATSVPDDRLKPARKEDPAPSDKRKRNELLTGTGKFVAEGNIIRFSPEFMDELYRAWPEVSIQQGVRNAGFDLKDVGYYRIYRLESSFRKARETGTAPGCLERRESPLTEEKVEELRENPFIDGVDRNVVRPGTRFYECAAILRSVPIDEVLEVFFIDHKVLTAREKYDVAQRLQEAETGDVTRTFSEGTVLCLHVLRRRENVLSRIVEEGYAGIAGMVPSLSPYQKKQLCLWIESLPKDPAHEYTTERVLGLAGVSRSAYYRYVKDEAYGTGEIRRTGAGERDADAVRRAFEYKGFRKGSRLIYMLLPRLEGRRIGLRRIRRIMKEKGMESGIRGPNEAKRQAGKRMEGAIMPNLLRRRFRLHRPNEVRVTDVTCLIYGDGRKAYGSALMDPVTGRLLAFIVSEHNDLEMALETLRRADSRPCIDGGIFHSDQGVLYMAKEFQKEILNRGLLQSMSKKGNCWDNATQESFFGHFKDECDCSECRDIVQLKERVAEYEDYYNNERGLWDRGRMTPVEYEEYLLSLNDGEFAGYLAQEEEKYNAMKERAAELAKKRYGTLGT